MVINLRVPDEIAALAEAREQRVEEFVQELLAQELGTQNSSASRSEAEVRDWLSSMGQFRQDPASSRNDFPRLHLSGTRRHIVTFNTSDFSRFSGIEAVHPSAV